MNDRQANTVTASNSPRLMDTHDTEKRHPETGCAAWWRRSPWWDPTTFRGALTVAVTGAVVGGLILWGITEAGDNAANDMITVSVTIHVA